MLYLNVCISMGEGNYSEQNLIGWIQLKAEY